MHSRDSTVHVARPAQAPRPCPGRRAGRRTLASALRALAGTLSAAGASIQVSAGLPFSDVSFTTTRPRLSPDGLFAVYRQDAVTDGGFDLWSVRTDGGAAPVRLSNPLASGQGQFLTFEISPDGARVVYAVDQETAGKTELYSVPIAGGALTRISMNMASDRDVIGFRISPTSDRVFYYSDRYAWTQYDLYSVPIDGPGAASVRLNPTLFQESDVDGFEVSPDGETVVYRAGRNSTGVYRLYSVPASGGDPLLLQDAQAPTGVQSYFRITPDGNRVLYLIDTTVDGAFDLYSVPIAVAAPELLTTGLAAGHSVESSFLVRSDSTRVVFRAATAAAQTFHLFSVPVAGGTVVRLNGVLASTEDVEPLFSISPNGSRVVYSSDEDANDIFDLWTVPIDGGARIRLNSALAPGGDLLEHAISADGTRVVYLADQAADGLHELWSVPIGGGTVTKLNRTLVFAGDAKAFRISSNSAWVVYGADQDTDEVDELLVVPIAGGAVEDLNDPLVAGGDVSLKFIQTVLFDLAANGRVVVYPADQTVDSQIELYTARLPGFAIFLDGFGSGDLSAWSVGVF